MASRTAKVASSVVAGLFAGASLSGPSDVARAAECLSTPRQDAPQGQHWYYRIDRANAKRHCWYLRDSGGKVAQPSTPDEASRIQKPAAQASEAAPRALEDARAEFPAPQPPANAGATVEQATNAVAPSPAAVTGGAPQDDRQSDAQGSSIAARWPSQIAAAPSSPAAPDTDNAAPDADAAVPQPTTMPAQQTAAVVEEKPSASLQMLFAAIFGALALAGLTASIVYRLGRGRRRDVRERRATIWDGVDGAPKPPWVAPQIEQASPNPVPGPAPARSATPSVVPQERYEKFEDILAQLVKQAQQSDA